MAVSNISSLALALVLVACGNLVYTSNDHRGQEFIFGFIENTKYSKIILTISAEADTDFTIYSPGFRLNYSGSLMANDSIRHELSGLYFYEGDLVVLKRAIYLKASSDVSLYCTSTASASSGSYLALPIERLGYDYIAASYDEEDKMNNDIASGYQRSALAVFAVEDKTEIEIEFKLGKDGKCGKVVSGDKRKLILNRYDAIGVRCPSDLTGTIIKSNKKVSVVSGNICTEVPKQTGMCDHLVEMMIPVSYLGKSYVVFDLSFRQMYGTYYRVIGISDKTRIETSMGTKETIDKQNFITYDPKETGPFCFSTDQPVLVMLYVRSPRASGEEQAVGDSFMSVVPPTTQYASTYKFNNNVRFNETFTHSFVSFMINPKVVYGLTMNKLGTVSVLDCCSFAVGTIEVTTSTLSLWHSSGESFGAFFYGYRNYEGYGMLAGMELEPESKPESFFSTLDSSSSYQDNCRLRLCSSEPCMNKANCTEERFSYSCSCQPGFAGAFCEININECSSTPCANNGTCADQINSFVCDCPSGFTGSTCETDINQCSSAPCTNNGTCADHTTSFVCHCPPGFTGATCETDIDDCYSNPCLNNGTCTDRPGSFVCTCSPGFVGDLCQTDFNECLLSPCLNGNCVNTVGSYACVCFNGYTGQQCENKMNCPCVCKSSRNVTTMEDIMKVLQINKETLSKTRRKHISVYDGRISSTTIGVGGMAFVVAAVVSIVAGDLCRCNNSL